MTSSSEPEKKPSWPLFVLAGFSFFPVLGIFVGGAAATWGLVSSRPRAITAAVIAMAGALVNIVGIIVFTVIFAGKGEMSQVWVVTSRTEMARVVEDLEKYHDSEHTYPASLGLLPGYDGPLNRHKLLDNSSGPFTLTRELEYVVSADGNSYDLFGTGPDKKLRTADDVRPVIADSIKARSGFRPGLAATQ